MSTDDTRSLTPEAPDRPEPSGHADEGAREVAGLAALMRSSGMLPTVPAALTDDVEARERLLASILVRARTLDDAPEPSPLPRRHEPGRGRRVTGSRRCLPSRGPRRAPLSRTLALATVACLAVVAIIGGEMTVTAPSARAGTPAPLVFSASDVDEVLDGTADDATDALDRLAQGIDTSAGSVVRDGSVQRVTSYAWLFEEDGDTGSVTVYPTQSTWWLAQDGQVQSTQRRTDAVGLDGRIDPDAAESAAGGSSTDTFGAGSLDASFADSLPRDPQDLTVELRQLSAGLPCEQEPSGGGTCLVASIQQVFSQYVVPPDLAAAMWSALADQPGVSELGTTVDRFGRDGLAVAVGPLPGALPVVTVLVVSPEDGQLLGVESVTLDDPARGISAPTVTGFTVWSSPSWVESLGD